MRREVGAHAHPPNLQIFGHSPVPVRGSQVNVHWGSVYYADMTYYTDPTSGAGVFDSGTNNWIPALAPCPPGHPCPAGFAQRVTSNLLRVVGQGPAQRTQPSHPNWQALPPY